MVDLVILVLVLAFGAFLISTFGFGWGMAIWFGLSMLLKK